MTFIPNVLSNIDLLNSKTGTIGPTGSFTGSYKNTIGYNMITVTINSDQNGKLTVNFSDDGINPKNTISDTYYENTSYNKDFEILKQYYNISYTNNSATGCNLSLASRLSTALSSNSVIKNDYNYENSNDFELDAFGKLRVTNPTTLIDVKFPGQSTGTSEFRSNNQLVCNLMTGSATGIYQNGYSLISITGPEYSRYVNQSRKYCIYQPGKSQLFLGSGIINYGNNSTDTSSKIGYFDDNNGFYFEYTGGQIYIRIRNNGINNNSAVQSNWNIDKMDGTGLSGLNLDFTKAQLFVIDFEWLGVGKIRFGFYANGRINYCHQILNINSLTGPYMLSANLPVRYELSGTGSASLKQICSTVISEGGYNPIGRTFSASVGSTGVQLVSNSPEIPILAIKGINTYNHENIIPTSFEVYSDNTGSNLLFIYKIRLFLSPSVNPLTGGNWSSVNNYSVIQYGSGFTGFVSNNSIIVSQGYSAGRLSTTNINLGDFFNNIFQLTSDINNRSDILLITAQSIGNNPQNIYSSITWQEIY